MTSSSLRMFLVCQEICCKLEILSRSEQSSNTAYIVDNMKKYINAWITLIIFSSSLLRLSLFRISRFEIPHACTWLWYPWLNSYLLENWTHQVLTWRPMEVHIYPRVLKSELLCANSYYCSPNTSDFCPVRTISTSLRLRRGPNVKPSKEPDS